MGGLDFFLNKKILLLTPTVAGIDTKKKVWHNNKL